MTSLNDLPTTRNPETRRDEVQCPKCGAFSGDDWSQCGGFCPLSISPHYHFGTEVRFANCVFEGGKG